MVQWHTCIQSITTTEIVIVIYCRSKYWNVNAVETSYNLNGWMNKYISVFEDLYENIEKSERTLSEKSNQIWFLVLSRDRNYEVIKDL